jgi:ankyrin repeat protein
MLAAEEGHEKVVARLLPLVGEGGLDVRDSDGHSALFGACLRGQVHTARMLLRAGASVGGENVEGNTIVQAVRRNGQRGSLALMQVRQMWINADSGG